MRYILSLLLISLSANFCYAATNEEADPLDLSIAENIAVPEVPNKAKKYVTTAIDQLRRQLINGGLTVETMRNGEVLQVTISCADLFAPCATELKASAGKILSQLNVVTRDSEKYKVLVAVHGDDTGDAQYADSITAARAIAIDDFFCQLAGKQDTSVIPYGIGMESPKVSNKTRANRDINRRVEITIIPNWGLLKMAGVKRKK